MLNAGRPFVAARDEVRMTEAARRAGDDGYSPKAALDRSVDDFVCTRILSPLLACLAVALCTGPIDLGLHPDQQLFGGLRGYPRPLKRLNLIALPKDLAAHVHYLAPGQIVATRDRVDQEHQAERLR
jgi:hypothetical protein